MAVFSRELALRIGSAMVMAPLVLAAVWFGDPFFPCLIALAAVLMQAEWIRISETGGLKALEWVRIVVLIGALALGAIGGWAQGLLLLLVLAVVTSVIGHPRDGVRLWPALGTLYIGIPCLAMLWLRDKPHVGRDVVLALLLVVWATDIGAYFVGRLVGGPKLAPRWSPNKTWSGAIGGLIAAILVGVAFAQWSTKVSILSAVLLSIGTALTAEIGDLIESMLKRRFTVKDTGSLIPGHGGLLDRLDSLLLAAPVVAIIVLVVSWRQ